MSDFKGFPKETLPFLKKLKANNTRNWFADNKQTYESAVKRPAEDFAAEMRAMLKSLTKSSHTAKIFRIHRDVRFSKDKTPYNTHVHIGFRPEGDGTTPYWFFGLNTERLTLGTGIFGFEKPELDTFRKRVDGKDGDTLAKLLAKLEKDGVRIGEPELKRVPAPYDADHKHADLLRRKGLSAWIDYPDAKSATDPMLVAECRAGFKRIKPVFDWLRGAP